MRWRLKLYREEPFLIFSRMAKAFLAGFHIVFSIYVYKLVSTRIVENKILFLVDASYSEPEPSIKIEIDGSVPN